MDDDVDAWIFGVLGHGDGFAGEDGDFCDVFGADHGV